mmetsp:Transcript_16899/g.21557  ORF Transcript_16899/g.21557 Transcript_16899/m.21557 type:complete len:448 (-) Transcript_16899:80-1423(-)
MDQERLHVSVIGPSSAGKSTLIASLLVHTGQPVPNGKPVRSLVDKGPFERIMGRSLHCSYHVYQTDLHNYVFYDNPGVRHIRRTARSVSIADTVILHLSAEMPESDLKSLRQFALMPYVYGIKQIFVVVSKMDSERVKYSQEKFRSLQQQIQDVLHRVGYKPAQVTYIPVSATTLENVTHKQENGPMSWYEGAPLIYALQTAPQNVYPTDQPFMMAIPRRYHTNRENTTTAFGRILSGKVSEGMTVVTPKGVEFVVKSIQTFGTNIKSAEAGEVVGIRFKTRGAVTKVKGEKQWQFKARALETRPDPRYHILSGSTLCEASPGLPAATEDFHCKVIIMKRKFNIEDYSIPTMRAHVACGPVRWVAFEKVFDRKGNVKAENPLVVSKGDVVHIRCKCLFPALLQPHTDFPSMGRIFFHFNDEIIAAGVVLRSDGAISSGRKTKAATRC